MAPPPPPAAHTFSVDGKAADGSTESGTIEVWSPLRVADMAIWQGWSPLDCTADPQRDAAVPFVLSATNTTSQFATTIGLRVLEVGAPFPATVSLNSSLTHDCQDSGSATDPAQVGVNSTQPVNAGTEVHAQGYVVIHGYYGPSKPNGDTTLLGRRTMLQVSSGQFGVTVSGPGACSGGGIAYLTLDGSSARTQIC